MDRPPPVSEIEKRALAFLAEARSTAKALELTMSLTLSESDRS